MASVSNNEGKRLCQWIGNSQLIAQENYLMTNDAHFAKAACEPVKADRNALRNALQSMAESDRTRLQAQNSDSEKSLVLPLCVDICSDMHDMPLLGTGIEPALLSEPEPKSGASASSATRAGMDLI